MSEVSLYHGTLTGVTLPFTLGSQGGSLSLVGSRKGACGGRKGACGGKPPFQDCPRGRSY